MTFLDEFNRMKSILCMCPHCSNISRLSDLNLRTRTKVPDTWLDDYKKREHEVGDMEQSMQDAMKKIRADATERGRAQVPARARKSMNPSIAALQYDPYDIKAILHPIDLVVFNGMNKGSLKDVVLLSGMTDDTTLGGLQRDVAKAVDERRYDWKTARVSDDGDLSFE